MPALRNAWILKKQMDDELKDQLKDQQRTSLGGLVPQVTEPVETVETVETVEPKAAPKTKKHAHPAPIAE